MIEKIIDFLQDHPKSTIGDICDGLKVGKNDVELEIASLFKEKYLLKSVRIEKKSTGGSISYEAFSLAPKGFELYNSIQTKLKSSKANQSDNHKEQKKIFLSHSYEDKKLAEFIIEKLILPHFALDKKQDIFFTSKRITGIRPALNWRNKIKSGIIDCKIFIALITPNFKKSEMCLGELGAAWVLNKQIYPLILRPISTSNFSTIISELQAEDISYKENIVSFIDSLAIDLKNFYNIDRNSIPYETNISLFQKSLRGHLRRNPFSNKKNV